MEILDYLKSFLSEEDSDIKDKPNNEKIWKDMICLANDNFEGFGELFTYFNDFVELYPSFKDSVPQSIVNSINSLTNSTKNIEDQIKIIQPIIVLGPFLPSKHLYLLIDNIITIIQKYLELNHDLPIVFLNFIDNLVLTSLESEVLDKIFSKIKELLDTPKGPASIAFFASISADYYQIEQNLDAFVKEVCDKYISKQEYQLSILFLISRFFNTTTGDETFVREKVIPLIDSHDEHISHIAMHTVIRLIQTQLINNIQCLEKIISLYPHCQSRYFFKVIKKFISIEDEDDDERLLDYIFKVAEKSKSFCMKVLNETDNVLIKSYCIDIIAEIGQSSSINIADCYQQVLDISTKLVNEEQFVSYPFISYYFVSMLKNFQEETKDVIFPLLKKLANSLENDEKIQNVKKSFELASNIAEIIDKNDECINLLPQITSFVNKKLISSNKEENNRACGVILSCPKKFSDSSASEFSTKIIDFASTNKSINEMKLITLTLHKLIKHYHIPESVFLHFSEKLLEGQLPVLHGEILPNQIPLQPNLFNYLIDFVTKYPSNQRIIQKMNDWLDNENGFPQVCDVLNHAINAKSGNEGLCTIIAQKLLNILQQSEYSLYKKDSLSVLVTIYNNYPSCFSPIEEFIDEFTDFLNNSEDEEEEDFDVENDAKLNDSAFKISIIKLLIDIYSSQTKMKVDVDTVLHFFDFMPFDEDKDFEDYIIKLNGLILKDQRFNFAKTGLATLYADMLIPKEDSISKFKESNADIIKKSFSNLVTKDKSIEKAVRNQIGKSASAVEAFEKLLKQC